MLLTLINLSQDGHCVVSSLIINPKQDHNLKYRSEMKIGLIENMFLSNNMYPDTLILGSTWNCTEIYIFLVQIQDKNTGFLPVWPGQTWEKGIGHGHMSAWAYPDTSQLLTNFCGYFHNQARDVSIAHTVQMISGKSREQNHHSNKWLWQTWKGNQNAWNCSFRE